MEKWMKRPFWVYLVMTGVVALGVIRFDALLGLAAALGRIVSPLVIGFALAYVLNIVLVRYERIYFPRSEKALVRRSRRAACVVLTLLSIALVLALVLLLVVPQLVDAVKVLGRAIPPAFERVKAWVLANRDSFPTIAEQISTLEIDWAGTLQKAVSFASLGVGGLVNTTLSVVTVLFGGAVNFIVSLMVALYLLVSKEKLLGQLERLAKAYGKPERVAKARRVFHIANRSFSAFIIGQFTEALIIGALCALGMVLFRFPYAVMIGAFIGVTALIPIVGAYLGAALGTFMILTVNPGQAIGFLIFILILQQVEGNIIYPRVVGTSVGLPGLWVLAAVTIGGGLLGILGMLLAVPTAATAYRLLKENVYAREHGLDPLSIGELPEETTHRKPEPPEKPSRRYRAPRVRMPDGIPSGSANRQPPGKPGMPARQGQNDENGPSEGEGPNPEKGKKGKKKTPRK